MCEHMWSLEEEIHWEETFIDKQSDYLELKFEELHKHRLRLEELYTRRTYLGQFLYFLKNKCL
jgi:hypothetical protein